MTSMKFAAQELKDAVAIAWAVGTKGAPSKGFDRVFLEHSKVGFDRVYATDGRAEVVAPVLISEFKGSGAVIPLNGSCVKAIMAAPEGPDSAIVVSVSVTGEEFGEAEVEIRTSNSKYKFDVGSTVVPSIAGAEWLGALEFSAESFLEMITLLSPICDPDATRWNLACVKLERRSDGMTMATATDGKRIARYHFVYETCLGTTGLVPSYLLIAVKKAVTAHAGGKDEHRVLVKFQGGRCFVGVGDITYSGSLVEGQFPVLDTSLEGFRRGRIEVGDIDREAFCHALEMARICTSRNTDEIGVTIEGKGDAIEFGANSSYAGRCSIKVPTGSPAFSTLVNSDYLIPVLKALDDDTVNLGVQLTGIRITSHALEYCVSGMTRD